MANIFDEVEKEYGGKISKVLPRTTIEMESGFENIPEGSKVQTTLTSDGSRVEGHAYPQLGQVSLGHTPLAQAPKQNMPRANALMNTVGMLGKGTQTTIGMPIDLLTMGINAIPGVNIQEPVMGSKWLNRATGADVWQPRRPIDYIAEAAGEQIPAMLAGPMVKSAKTGTGLLQQTKPLVAPTIGSSIGTGGARAADLGPLGELGGALLGGFAGAPRTLSGAVLGETAERLGAKAPRIAAALTPADDLNKLIKYDYTKAIRPSVSGKQAFDDWKKSTDRAVDAIKSIVYQSRKTNTPVPTDLEQFSNAVQDTRRAIFNDYSKMTAATGEQGAVINLKPIIADLEKIRLSKPVQDFGGGAVDNIDNLIDIVSNRQTYTPAEAEEAIALLNKKLQGYYSGRSSGLNEVTASVYDTVARVLRGALDDTIEKYTGPGYQQLKNQYGALRSIEKDVMNRTITDARKAPSGLLDFSDMFSASKAVYSAAKLDPAGAAAAGTMFALKKGMKARNDPNKIVQKMFSRVSKRLPEKEQWGPLPEYGERFTMHPYEGQVTSERALVPTGRTTQRTVNGEYTSVTPLTGGERAGLLEAPKNKVPVNMEWKPVNNPGGPADRVSTLGTTAQQVAPFDFDATLKNLVDSGYSPIEARDTLLRQIKAEMAKRRK